MTIHNIYNESVFPSTTGDSIGPRDGARSALDVPKNERIKRVGTVSRWEMIDSSVPDNSAKYAYLEQIYLLKLWHIQL